MSALAYFLLAAVIILSVWLFFSRRGGRRDLDTGIGHETTGSLEWDSLTSELSARIFAPEDSDFVASETSRRITHQFRRERTVLALDWLRAVRGQVNQLFRAHVRAVRGNAGLKPADEIRLGFEFALFQLTNGILYLVIWACGPPRAAKLVGYSLELAGQMRKVTDDVLPSGRQVPVEILEERRGQKN